MCGRHWLVAFLAVAFLLGTNSIAQQTDQQTGITVLIAQPSDRSLTSEARVQVQGRAGVTAPGASLFSVVLSVNGVATSVDFDSEGRFQKEVDLVIGANTITAIAVASNKAMAFHTVTITYQLPGQVIFFDSFDEVPRPEWSPVSGTWVTINGEYTVGPDIRDRLLFGSLVVLSSLPGVTPERLLPGYAVEVDVKLGSAGSSPYVGNAVNAYIFAKVQDLKNGIVLILTGRDTQIQTVQWRAMRGGDLGAPLGVASVTTKPGGPVHVRVEAKGMVYRVYVNGIEVPLRISVPDFPNATGVGVGFWYESLGGGWERTTFDNFKVSLLEQR